MIKPNLLAIKANSAKGDKLVGGFSAEEK